MTASLFLKIAKKKCIFLRYFHKGKHARVKPRELDALAAHTLLHFLSHTQRSREGGRAEVIFRAVNSWDRNERRNRKEGIAYWLGCPP